MADEDTLVTGEVEIDGEAYRLLAFQSMEELSTVPTAIIDVTMPTGHASAGPPEPKALVGKPVKISLKRGDEKPRTFVGAAVSVMRSGDTDGRPFARIRVAPRLFRLGKRADCRTFQEKSVPDIVKKVLSDAGIPEGDQEQKLSGSYPARVYTVQYRESDLDFIARLLSEEGVYFGVRFEDGKDKVIFGDDPAGFGEIEGESTLPFANTFGFVAERPCVMWVKEKHEIQPDKVFTRDYDFERPKFKLEAQVEGKDKGPHALEVYTFPGKFVDQGVGKRYAQVLLDSMQAARDVLSGESSALTLVPGYKFTIEGHPFDPINQEYLITSVETEVREGFSQQATKAQEGRNYVCRFTAVPTGKTAYRPPRIERSIPMVGVETAVTTGPSGGEIYTDKHGRVKIKYMWDRLAKNDDTSSLWVRTSQAPTGGSMLLPRVGWEVSVRHVEGDPDTPVVMTRLYNAVTPPPYALPANKARGSVQTATTPGGGSSNEFRMDDTKGKEEMMFNASKDMTVDVVNNTTEHIGNNESHSIGSNHKVNVTNSVVSSVGSNQKISVGGNQTVHVETFMVDQCGGDRSLSIGGNRDMKVGGDHRLEVGGAAKKDVGSMQTDLVVGSVTDGTSGSMSVSVGTALAEITAGDRSFTVGGDRNETTGAAKAVITAGGRGVEVGGSLTQKVAGAILAKIGGDRADNAGATFTEVAAGAHILKADNVVFEGDGIVSFVMGASTITLTPASISIAGVSIKLDGATAETAALILDN